MAPEPVGERIARVETKIDGLTFDVREALRRMDTFATKADVDAMKSGRKWAIGTVGAYLSVIVAIVALGVSVVGVRV